MSVFEDKKFQELDWLTQITETIRAPLNDKLANLPDEIEIDSSNMFSIVGYRMNIHVSDVLRSQLGEHAWDSFTYEERDAIASCYEFTLEEGTEFDFKTKTISKPARLVKITFTLDDNELQKMLGNKGVQAVSSLSDSAINVQRVQEVLDILDWKGDPKVRKSKAKYRLNCLVRNRLQEIFSKNEWRIRDACLANKIGVWVARYIGEGNLCALTNLCKVKVMTHSNLPIYSIEEEV